MGSPAVGVTYLTLSVHKGIPILKMKSYIFLENQKDSDDSNFT